MTPPLAPNGGERESLARLLFETDHPWVREKPINEHTNWDTHTNKDGAPDGAQRRYFALADAALARATSAELTVTALRERLEGMEAALRKAIKIADEAREEWDEAPNGMRAGKTLIALSGGCPGYRSDIDDIHAILAKGPGR